MSGAGRRCASPASSFAGQGIAVVGERFLPLGDEQIDHLMADIAATRPQVVVNSLIGPSNYAFMRGSRSSGRRARRRW
ncbi:MAG: transporter substrate-binding protein [Paracoccaceae bacterium]